MLSKVLHAIAYEEAQAQREPEKYMRPSKAGRDRCMRKTVYEFLGARGVPITGRAIHVFDDGHWHHELMKDWIRKSAYMLHSEEMEVKTKVGPGHIDGIITTISAKDFLLECKSINHFGYERLGEGAWPMDHLDQVALYLDSEELSDAGITDAVILYKNKNQGAYTDITVQYDQPNDTLRVLKLERSSGETETYDDLKYENIVTDCVERMLKINHLVEAKTLPRRQYHWSDWQCQYCQFLQTCWKDWEKESIQKEGSVTLSEEIAHAIRYRGELAEERREITKKYDEITDMLESTLKEADSNRGFTESYEVYIEPMRKMFDRTRLTKSEIERATVYVPNEKPKVRKRKDAD